MKLEYAFFAENADRLEDGRLCIFGADFDTYQVPETPVAIQFRLVLKLSLEAGETYDGHTFGLQITNPAGERTDIGEPSSIEVARKLNATPEMTPVASMFVRLAIRFLNFGVYRIHVLVDGVEAKELRMNIDRIAQEGATDA